jgi:hypothetical protein
VDAGAADQPDVAAGRPLGCLLRVLAALALLSLPPTASGDQPGQGRDGPPPRSADNRTDHGFIADDSPAAHAPAFPDAPALPSDGRQLGQPLSPEEEQRAIDSGWQF